MRKTTPSSASEATSLPTQALIGTIRLYQQFVRPFINIFLHLTFGFASQCKQSPTCSEYTIFQIRNHGTITGLKLGLIRFWNCR